MEFIDIPGGDYTLGWRFDDELDEAARSGLASFMPMDEILQRFSKRRTVTLKPFAIATAALSVDDILSKLDDEVYDELLSLEDVCDKLDELLEADGLRVPTEDELEAACGGALFAWGNDVPPGEPYGNNTTFTKHLEPTSRGLELDGNTYHCEVTRSALKLGDGGEAVCGGYPWPVAWLSLSPSYRLAGDPVEDLLFEFLEEAIVRPVRR